LYRNITAFDVLSAKLRHGSTNWRKVNKNLVKFSCGCYCYFNVYYASD